MVESGDFSAEFDGSAFSLVGGMSGLVAKLVHDGSGQVPVTSFEERLMMTGDYGSSGEPWVSEHPNS